MELGRCPTCATPYTAADVAGVGILRARPEAEGGPRLEYRCGQCQRVLTLVPHGEGRYAPPGEPPPPAVPMAARRPHWVRAQGEPGPTCEPGPRGPSAAAPPQTGPGSTHHTAPREAAPAPLDLLGAYALLGVRVTAEREEIERAFRSRSLTCHPDKVTHLDAEFQALAEQKFKRLVEALRLVTDGPKA